MTAFPLVLNHSDKTWWQTGKLGTIIQQGPSQGKSAAEYSAFVGSNEHRLWLTADFSIIDEG